MGSRYQAELLTREIFVAILKLAASAAKYTSKEITAILSSDYEPAAIRSSLYKLKQQNSIHGSAYHGYTITDKGLAKLERMQLQLIPQREAWDGKWRLVIYDIPEPNRHARDLVRKLIKQTGFRRLQQSVWAHPLPCLREFEQIRDAYAIQAHLLLVETPHGPDFEELLREFSEVYPRLSC